MGRGAGYSSGDVIEIKALMDVGKKATEIVKLFPGRSLRPLRKLMKEIKDGKNVQRKTRTKPPTVATRVLAGRIKRDLSGGRRRRAHSVRKLAAKRKVKKTSVHKVLKTVLTVDSKRPYKTFKITSKQAKKRLDWAKNTKKSIANGSLDLPAFGGATKR